MGYPGGVDHPGLLELGPLRSEAVEEPGAAAEQDWHEVNLEFVEQARRQALLHDLRATCH